MATLAFMTVATVTVGAPVSRLALALALTKFWLVAVASCVAAATCAALLPLAVR